MDLLNHEIFVKLIERYYRWRNGGCQERKEKKDRELEDEREMGKKQEIFGVEKCVKYRKIKGLACAVEKLWRKNSEKKSPPP